MTKPEVLFSTPSHHWYSNFTAVSHSEHSSRTANAGEHSKHSSYTLCLVLRSQLDKTRSTLFYTESPLVLKCHCVSHPEYSSPTANAGEHSKHSSHTLYLTPSTWYSGHNLRPNPKYFSRIPITVLREKYRAHAEQLLHIYLALRTEARHKHRYGLN